MTEQSSEPERSDEQSEAQSRFRRQIDIDAVFEEITRDIDDEPTDPETKRRLRVRRTLDAIARNNIRTLAAHLVRINEIKKGGEYRPADPSNVRAYLYDLMTVKFSTRTAPPKKIMDIGSVDEDLIAQTLLSDTGYAEEIREMVTFSDPESDELSVLEFPKIRQGIIELDRGFIEKAIILEMLDEHGIVGIIAVDDRKAWDELRDLVEALAEPEIAQFSAHLLEHKQNGKTTLVRDVVGHLEDWFYIRQKAFEIAQTLVNSPPYERKNVFDGLAEHMKPHVQRYLEDLDAMADQAANHTDR